ncbi:MAG: hypothetical protein ACK5MT_04640 [Actinomycetales bacterium]
MDANVWYSRYLRDWIGVIYTTGDDRPFQVFWTEDIMAEVLYHLRKQHPEWAGEKTRQVRDLLAKNTVLIPVPRDTPGGDPATPTLLAREPTEAIARRGPVWTTPGSPSPTPRCTRDRRDARDNQTIPLNTIASHRHICVHQSHQVGRACPASPLHACTKSAIHRHFPRGSPVSRQSTVLVPFTSRPALIHDAVKKQLRYHVEKRNSVDMPKHLRDVNCPEFADRVETHLQAIARQDY